MVFQQKNDFWLARASVGYDVLMADPAKLMEACHEYFKWVKDNPLYETVVGWHKGKATKEEIPKMRAMTSNALSLFLGITPKTLIEWKRERKDLAPVIEWAEGIIRDQKLSGAAAGLLNANIIARELGLKDHIVNEAAAPVMNIKGPDGGNLVQPPIQGE